MPFTDDAFAWAAVSLVGLQGATSLFSGHVWSRSRWFVGVMLLLTTVGRAVLPLPFVDQPRLDPASWHATAGWMLFGVGIAILLPAMGIRWWEPPEPRTALRTTGIHGVIRHPIYLGELLWPIGLSLAFGSIVGLALTPVWWLVFLVHALSEEAALERELGQPYRDYQAKVRGRMLPGLPF